MPVPQPVPRRRSPFPAAALAPLLAFLALAALAPGCASSRVVVPMAPPAVRGEVRPPRPGPTWVWVPGRWRWQGEAHAWIPGHWKEGRPGKNWDPGHWKRVKGGWVWESGRWESA